MAVSPIERPTAAHEAAELASRSMPMDEVLRRQIALIAWLRSMGEPWGEAVNQLRDMVVGLEDDEFWDGIPAHVREDQARVPGHRWAEIREHYAPQGWNDVPVTAFQGPDGPIFEPTDAELSAMLKIILRLLHRRSLTWRLKRMAIIDAPEGEDHDDADR